MPQASQIFPDHLYPHQKVTINDNTEVMATITSDAGNINYLFVFASPKGKDGVVQTIKGGLKEFKKEYGLGPFSMYGQPLLNAYGAFSTGYITGHCLRVSAPNASYANLHLCAKYKKEIGEDASSLKIQLIGVSSTDPLTDLSQLEESYVPEEGEDIEGWKTLKLLSVAYKGKGKFGNNVRIRITSNAASDQENDYKNYFFEEYTIEDGTSTKNNEFAVAFSEYAKYSGMSLFADSVINASAGGSNLIEFISYPDAFIELFNAYKECQPDTILTAETFDPILGINKYTKKAITGLEIDTSSEGVVAINSLSGVALSGGNDGDLDEKIDAKTRQATLDKLYLSAFEGSIDPLIASENKYPTTFIMDANYTVETKIAMATLASKRQDCALILDCGLGITTKASIIPYVTTNLDSYVIERTHDIEAYVLKVTDPYSGRLVKVTSTYLMAINYPGHIMSNGNGYKHVPMAGNNYGKLSGYVENSIYPVFDEDLDSELMDELAENRINFVCLNANQDIVRKTQTTRQNKNSNLSELNNVLVLLDIRRDCKKICTAFEFNFAEAKDLAMFNEVARDTLGFYKDQQVTKIEAQFDANAWESERNIVHLYVEMVNKKIVKHFLIEIDVNRE